MVTRLLTLAGALLLLCAAPAQAATVTKTADTDDGLCDADCSLREAINATNLNGADDTVTLPAGTYLLTRGALPNVTDTLSIDGAGAATTVIRQTVKGRVISAAVALTVDEVTLTGGDDPGNGGGILKTGTGQLTIRNSVVGGNHADGSGNSGEGGGGIYVSGGGLVLRYSTVTGNSSGPHPGDANNNGGGGIHFQSPGGSLTIDTSTIDGNSTTLDAGTGSNNGGGGVWTSSGGPFVRNSTVTENRVIGAGVAVTRGGGILNSSTVDVGLTHTILAGNSATIGANCAATQSGSFASQGNNLESHDTCGLDVNLNDQPATDPRLGPLEDNGGGTSTRELLVDTVSTSPAVNAGDQTSGFCDSFNDTDQRGVNRVRGDDCDIGAYEFDGRTIAAVPGCSPTGRIPLTMVPAPGEGVEDFRYRIDGGPEQVADVPDAFEAASTVIELPEGRPEKPRQTLEYWGNFSNGDELDHHEPSVLVDKTRPTVDVRQTGRFRTFVIRRRETVTVQASDALSGLVGDPSGRPRIDTSSRGSRTVQQTATDLCGHQATDSLDYRVLAPALGTRAVLEVVGGAVRFGRRAGSGSAGAAQKGQRFTPLSEPREVPIGSFIDTRRGQVRITASRNRRSGLQAGRFSAGIFQVFQSRRRRARGLTTLALKGSSFRRCRRSGRGKRAGAAQSRLVRRLRANARGRFRTRGRHSAATVRGTVWITADRCDGTLTRVIRGRVAVRDFRRGRTILLRAGKSFLARPSR